MDFLQFIIEHKYNLNFGMLFFVCVNSCLQEEQTYDIGSNHVLPPKHWELHGMTGSVYETPDRVICSI